MLEQILAFIPRAIMQGTPLLFGATGEIITEKSGNLNLGIPGIMYIGAISGVVGAFFFETSGLPMMLPEVIMIPLAIIITLISSLLGSLLASLIYCFLTVTLRANQNVTGLALTTFGVGIGNFLGGSLIKITGSDVPFLALTTTAGAFKSVLPFAKEAGFLVYLAVVIALIAHFVLKKTRVGLHLRAVGESPATADAAGINVTKYKYFSTCIGGMVAGLGGLYFVMDYSNGIWANNGFGDRGWLAIALVIFAVWKPAIGIFGSYLFGGLYILYNYSKVPMMYEPLMQMIPYVVTIIVLVTVSMRRKKETQPPASLGLSYFREDR